MMRAFSVTVRTEDQGIHRYPAIGYSSAAVHIDALDRFGGLCSVFVKPA